MGPRVHSRRSEERIDGWTDRSIDGQMNKKTGGGSQRRLGRIPMGWDRTRKQPRERKGFKLFSSSA